MYLDKDRCLPDLLSEPNPKRPSILAHGLPSTNFRMQDGNCARLKDQRVLEGRRPECQKTRERRANPSTQPG